MTYSARFESKSFTLLLAIISLTLMTVSSKAQSPNDEEWHARDGQIQWSFEGIYIGGSLGLGFGSVDVESPTDSGSMRPGGLMAGMHFGMNRRYADHLITGWEVDWQFGSFDDTDATFGRLEFASHATARGILGYEIARDKMVYGALGLTGAGVEFDDTANNDEISWLWGVQFGIGYEQYVRSDMRVRFEYNVNTFENWDFPINAEIFESRPTIHTLRVGVSLALDPSGH